jgi:hypothetical protein
MELFIFLLYTEKKDELYLNDWSLFVRLDKKFDKAY